MQPTNFFSTIRRTPRSNNCRWFFLALVLILSVLPNANAENVRLLKSGSPQSLAFARYIASVESRSPFQRSGPVAVAIEATLPGLYKRGSVLAVLGPGEKGRSKYSILYVGGDGTVLAEVIGRYFDVADQIDSMPASAIAITPANYKFRFAGEVRTAGAPAYVYRISPKRKQPGLVAGQLWMDSGTGAEVMLAGHSAKLRSIAGRAEVVRDTTLLNGLPFASVTHMAFTIPHLGRAELVITEILRPIGRLDDGKQPDKTSAFLSSSTE